MTRFFWFVKSLSELTGICVRKLGKTIMNAENSLTALLPGATVFCTKFRIVQGQFRWKIESVGFPQTLVSTRSKHRKTLNCQSKKGAQRTKNSSKSCRNQTKRAEQATREAHAASSYMEQCVATPRSTMLHESLYKYGSNFETEGRQLVER